jgi:O-acetyl-ADP-ribose deacetylase (regulator of RNase III)
VIHTVGPVWRGGRSGEPELLAAAYRASLKLAHDNALRSIAFPAISTGVYGYPPEEAARVALAAVDLALETHTLIREVRLVFLRGQTPKWVLGV